MRVPVELLVLICLLVGVLPQWTVGGFLDAAARPVVGGEMPEFSLAVWHGFNTPFMMSLVALVGGTLLYLLLLRRRSSNAPAHTPGLARLDGKEMFEWVLAVLTQVGRRGRTLLGTHKLQWQMLWLVAFALMAAALPLWTRGLTIGNRAALPFEPAFALLWALGMGCALATAWQAKYHRLAALTLLGARG